MSVTAIKDSFNPLGQKRYYCAESAIAALSKAVTTAATVNRFWILDFGFWIGSAFKGRSLTFGRIF